MKQETVLTIIMITVTIVLLIGATVAWFLGNKPVTIKNFMQQAGEMDKLNVKMAVLPDETASGGSENQGSDTDNQEEQGSQNQGEGITYWLMSDINNMGKVIDIDLAKLTNIEDGKLGPGSFGTIKFEISTTSSEVMNYIICIKPEIEVADGDNVTSQVTKEELQKLVEMHIKFYAKYDDTKSSTPNMAYSEVIPYADSTSEEGNVMFASLKGLKGSVSSNKVEYITIYWYWPYEYTDIPGYGNENFSSTIYNPWKTTGDENSPGEYDARYPKDLSLDEKIEKYDIDDTKIGNYVTNLKLHFEVCAE